MATYREAATVRAAQFIGVKEQPPNSNHGPQIDKWGERCIGVKGGFPWCAAFVWCMFDDVGLKIRSIAQPALVQSWVKWAGDHGLTVVRPYKYDVVCFDWNEDGTKDHIGFVEKVLALRWSQDKRFIGWIRTVEGNTGVGNDSNGGEVMRRWRWVNSKTVFIRVRAVV